MGFIGGHIFASVYNRGEAPVGIDLPAPNDALACLEVEQRLDATVAQSSGVFHIGAITDTTYVKQDIWINNYEFTKHLIDLCVKHKKRMVFASSAAVYGNDGDNIPKTHYAWTKKACEDYGLSQDLDFISLRYFNVYGPGEEQKGGMASIAYQAYTNGQYHDLFPGIPERDFVYVKDVADATIHAMYDESIPSGVYDLGTTKSHTFEEMLTDMGCTWSHTTKDRIPLWYQFNTKADPNKLLPNWKPKYTLEAGCKEYREYLNATT